MYFVLYFWFLASSFWSLPLQIKFRLDSVGIKLCLLKKINEKFILDIKIFLMWYFSKEIGRIILFSIGLLLNFKNPLESHIFSIVIKKPLYVCVSAWDLPIYFYLVYWVVNCFLYCLFCMQNLLCHSNKTEPGF